MLFPSAVAHISRRVAKIGFVLLVPAFGLGCNGSCAPKDPNLPASIPEPVQRLAMPPNFLGDDSEDEEQRELEDELRERQKALAALQAYKAESCVAATAKMEAALHKGKGRWHERDEQDSLPADLLTLLLEAEMWRDQAKEMCAADPQRGRYDELRSVMEMIWRYPVTSSRQELDQRLAILEGGKT